MTRGMVLRVAAVIFIIMLFTFILFLVTYSMSQIDEPSAEKGKVFLDIDLSSIVFFLQLQLFIIVNFVF